MFKDMTDEALQENIRTLQSLIANGVEMRQRRGIGRMLRDLDIAVAVKRQRIRAGTWTLGA